MEALTKQRVNKNLPDLTITDNKNPWISVKDRLPKEGQLIVMHDREYDMYQTIYYPEPCITDRMDYWMPIIELPMED